MKYRSLWLLPFAFLGVVSPILAQEAPLRRTISVTGQAEVKIAPDEAVFTFGIETSNNDIDEARKENDRRVEELLALTKRLGIRPEHIQTDYLNIEPRYDYDSETRKRTFLGYFMRRNVVVTLRDLSKFTELLSSALKLGVTHVRQAQFRTTELRRHRDSARAMAIRAAKEKAVDLAKELGMKVGKPISIDEESSEWSSRNYAVQNASSSLSSSFSVPDDGESTTLAAGQISISARVSVTFDLE